MPRRSEASPRYLRPVNRRLLCVFAGYLALSGARALAQPVPPLPEGSGGWRQAGLEGVRGVTVGPIESSLQPDRGYGTEASAALLDELRRFGVNWISVTPFGRLWSLESTQISMDFEEAYDENRAAVHRMVAQAHARGIRVLLIPHLWVETGGWRGEIDPGNDDRWSAFRESYRRFVVSWAQNAADAGADAFSIGVECASWSGRFGGFWTALIAEIRTTFPGLLTYSANWDEADNVLFWDQLDLIGINAFYPLADQPNATDDDYRRGAERIVPRVYELATTVRRPVWFVEVGYTTCADAAVQPWLWPDHMEEVVIDEREQARALDSIFGAFLPQPWFVGAFLWRYYANLDDVSQEAVWGFSPHGKEAESVLRRIFHRRAAVDPDPRSPRCIIDGC